MKPTTRVSLFFVPISCSRALRMRFDKTPWKEPFFRRDHANDDKMEHTKGEENTPSVAGDPPIHGSSFSSAGYSPNMKSWIASTVDQLPHPSMKPKAVDLAFTPYPLPKYDPSLGFGPVVLKNIPDIHKAQQRFSTTPSTPSSSPPQQTTGAATFKDADVEEDLGVARQAPEVEEPPLPMPERSGWVTESPATPLPSIASRSPRASATKRPIAFADWRADGRDERETLSLRQSGIVDPDSGETATTASQAPPEAEDADAESAALTPSSAWETDAAPLAPPSYFVEGDERLRILDRLVCRRSLKDLLHQFTSRPQREARTATVLDLASTLSLRRTEEFTSLFYELTSLFATSSGNTQAGGGLGVGLQFLVAKVVKFGRPYYVTDELMKAYLVLLASATEYFTQVAPHHLFPSYFSFSTASSSPLSASVVMFSPDMVSAEGSTSASLCIQLLHFLAVLRVFQPNLWYSPNPNAPSNRADYSHPRGANRLTAYRRDGEELFDYIEQLVLLNEQTVCVHHLPSSKESSRNEGKDTVSGNAVGTTSFSFLEHFSLQGLLNMLKGFAAVSVSGVPSGDVSDTLWNEVERRIQHADGDIHSFSFSPAVTPIASSCSTTTTRTQPYASSFGASPLSMTAFLEDLYLTLTLIGWTGDQRRDRVLEWLLTKKGVVLPHRTLHGVDAGVKAKAGHTVSCRTTAKKEERTYSAASSWTSHSCVEEKEVEMLRRETGESHAEKIERECFGPNFFAAASQEVCESLKQDIVQGPLTQTLQFYYREALLKRKTEGEALQVDANRDVLPSSSALEVTSPFYAVVESSCELLMSLTSKSLAVAFARTHHYDRRCLEMVSPCEEAFRLIAERVAFEAGEREKGMPSVDALSYLSYSDDPSLPRPLSAAVEKHSTHDAIAPSPSPLPLSPSRITPLSLRSLPARSLYLTRYHGKRVHPIRTFLSDLAFVHQLHSVFILHSSCVTTSVESLRSALQRARSGKEAVVCTSSFLLALAKKIYFHHGGVLTGKGKDKVRPLEENAARRALSMIAQEMQKGRVVLVPFTEELLLHDAGVVCEEDLMLWTVAAFMARELPHVKVHTLQHAFSAARQPHHTLKGPHSPLRSLNDPLYSRAVPLLASLSSKRLRAVTHHVRLQQKVRDPPPRLHKVHPIRARFIYRRDRGLYDKYHVTARHLAPGFAQGALDSDLRGLGFYTPDHPQVEFLAGSS